MQAQTSPLQVIITGCCSPDLLDGGLLFRTKPLLSRWLQSSPELPPFQPSSLFLFAGLHQGGCVLFPAAWKYAIDHISINPFGAQFGLQQPPPRGLWLWRFPTQNWANSASSVTPIRLSFQRFFDVTQLEALAQQPAS